MRHQPHYSARCSGPAEHFACRARSIDGHPLPIDQLKGTIKAQGVREVQLFKETQTTRLGIIFHQSTPNELDVSSDSTPRGNGRQPVVLPVIKVLDKAGIAGSCTDLHEGDQVLSVNGHAALSNVQTVQMLRDAVGPLTLAVRETVISKTPRGTTNRVPLTGLRPINMPS